MNRSSGQKISKTTEIQNDTTIKTLYQDSTFKKKTKTTHTFDVYMEHSPGLTTYYGTKQTSPKLRV